MPIEIESPEQFGYANIECNLAESSVTDALYKDLSLRLEDIVLAYGHHVGKLELRELIVSECRDLDASDVLLTAGAASSLFIVATSLLDRNDHVMVMHPNYATNIETPRAIGCEVDLLELKFEERFHPDIGKLERQLTPSTRLLSVTTPHNPTGMVLTQKELEGLLAITERENCFLLVDETYRDLNFGKPPPLAASLSDRVISISSLSKAYGLPGIRIGWIVTRNEKLKELFLAAKEQIFICNSVVDEEIAWLFLLKKNRFFPTIREHVERNFTELSSWMNRNPYLEWVKPEGGAVCFPRFKSSIGVNFDSFYSTLNDHYKTFTGPGHWFGMDRRYMRIGYAWPSTQTLEKGLGNIMAAANYATKANKS